MICAFVGKKIAHSIMAAPECSTPTVHICSRQCVITGANKIWRKTAKALEPCKFEIVTAVAMKNVVCWNIKPQFEPHRRHITSPLQSSAG
jgi:hypothetical protein